MRLTKLTSFGLLMMMVTLTLLLATNPQHVPVELLIIPPVTTLLGLVIFCYQILGKFNRYNHARFRAKRLLYATVCAGLPVLLLVLKSINQLAPKDVALVIVLAVLTGFYISRFSFAVPIE